MNKVKSILTGTFLTAALLSGMPAAADEAPATPLFGASCPSAAAQAPEPMWKTSNGCYQMSLCPNDDYCWSLCPEATAASCTNSVCQFTLPGGGSGPGGGGGGCPQQGICVEDYHCVFPGGITGTCVNGSCVC